MGQSCATLKFFKIICNLQKCSRLKKISLKSDYYFSIRNKMVILKKLFTETRIIRPLWLFWQQTQEKSKITQTWPHVTSYFPFASKNISKITDYMIHVLQKSHFTRNIVIFDSRGFLDLKYFSSRKNFSTRKDFPT